MIVSSSYSNWTFRLKLTRMLIYLVSFVRVALYSKLGMCQAASHGQALSTEAHSLEKKCNTLLILSLALVITSSLQKDNSSS